MGRCLFNELNYILLLMLTKHVWPFKKIQIIIMIAAHLGVYVYTAFLVLFRGYIQDVCKHCHEAYNQF